MQNFDDLIDRAQIVAAEQKLAAAREKLADVHAARDIALREHAAAKIVYDASLDLGGNPATAAHAALKAAEASVEMHADRLGAPAYAVKIAGAALVEAKAAAQQPVHDGACAAAIEACREADSARSALAASEQRFREAVAAFTAAVRDGAQPAFRGMGVDAGSPSLTRSDGVFQLPTEAEMRKRLCLPAS